MPLPVRIRPGEFVTDPGRYEQAQAASAFSRSKVLAIGAQARLAALGVKVPHDDAERSAQRGRACR